MISYLSLRVFYNRRSIKGGIELIVKRCMFLLLQKRSEQVIEISLDFEFVADYFCYLTN